MENLILVGVVVIFIALTKAFKTTIDKNLIVPASPRQDNRQYSEAEIAAKSMGYWEQMLRNTTDTNKRTECFNNIRAAQLALIYCTGDFVPELAKQDLGNTPKTPMTKIAEPLPANVVSLASAKQTKSDADFFDRW